MVKCSILLSFFYCGRCQEKKCGAVTTRVAIELLETLFDANSDYIRKDVMWGYPSHPVTLKSLILRGCHLYHYHHYNIDVREVTFCTNS